MSGLSCSVSLLAVQPCMSPVLFSVRKEIRNSFLSAGQLSMHSLCCCGHVFAHHTVEWQRELAFHFQMCKNSAACCPQKWALAGTFGKFDTITVFRFLDAVKKQIVTCSPWGMCLEFEVLCAVEDMYLQ